jgi:hypothetical protein
MANELVVRTPIRALEGAFVTGSVDISETLTANIVNGRTALEQGGAGQTFVTDGLAAAFSIALG